MRLAATTPIRLPSCRNRWSARRCAWHQPQLREHLNLVEIQADRADLPVLDAKEPHKGKVELLPGRRNLCARRATPSTCMRAGVSRLFNHVLAVLKEDNITTPPVRARRY